jgi:plasmid stabilization system protein ParE
VTLRVILAAQAARDVAEVDQWWRENRRAAPDLFLEEFSAALQLIRIAPFVGRQYRETKVPHVRRLLMRATRYHVYYAIGDAAAEVLAVWSAVRGTGPDLHGPA